MSPAALTPAKRSSRCRRLSRPAGIHQALDSIFQALACGEIDSKRAGSLLYALQIAQKNLETTPSLAQNPTPARPLTGP